MRTSQQRPGRRTARGARAAGGFTILETVIALCIALIVGFGAISLFLFAASFNAGASDRARALALAQELMEDYRATPFADLATTNATQTITRGDTEEGADQRAFTVNTTVAYDAAVADNRQRVITVTVTPVATNGRFTAGGVTLMMLRASDEFGDN